MNRSHRRLILPQLGAPGVAAHSVKEQSGFRVIYGPIKATDLPAFLEAGRKATPAMRRKAFPMASSSDAIWISTDRSPSAIRPATMLRCC